MNSWPSDTSAMLYHLSYEANDVGSRSIVGSYVPVREMGVNDMWNKSYVNCGNEMKKWSSQWTQYVQLRKEAWKKFRVSFVNDFIASAICYLNKVSNFTNKVRQVRYT